MGMTRNRMLLNRFNMYQDSAGPKAYVLILLSSFSPCLWSSRPNPTRVAIYQKSILWPNDGPGSPDPVPERSSSLRQTHNSPLTMPGPPPGTGITAPALCCPELLVLSSRQANNDVGLARPQGEEIDAGSRAHGADCRSERRRRIPVCLRLVSACHYMCREVRRLHTSPVSLR